MLNVHKVNKHSPLVTCECLASLGLSFLIWNLENYGKLIHSSLGVENHSISNISPVLRNFTYQKPLGSDPKVWLPGTSGIWICFSMQRETHLHINSHCSKVFHASHVAEMEQNRSLRRKKNISIFWRLWGDLYHLLPCLTPTSVLEAKMPLILRVGFSWQAAAQWVGMGHLLLSTPAVCLFKYNLPN